MKGYGLAILTSIFVLFSSSFAVSNRCSLPQNCLEESESELIDSLNVRLVGNWPFGYCLNAEFDAVRNLTFCGSGGGVYILQRSASGILEIVSDKICTRGIVYGLFYEQSDSMLYIADWKAGLDIWDVSAPENPYWIGNYNIHYYPPYKPQAREVIVSGSYAFVAYEGLRIVDISTPSNPQEIGSYLSGTSYGIAVSDTIAYLACGATHGLRIVNISLPSNPELISYYWIPGQSQTMDVVVSDSLAYLADGWSGLRILNISDPAHPQEVGYYDTPHFLVKLEIAGNYAYLTETAEFGLHAFLRILDITDPANPYQIASLFYPGCATNIALFDSVAFLTIADQGLKVINIKDPYDPFQIDYFVTPSPSINVSVRLPYAYLVMGSTGLKIIDVSDPSCPQHIGYYDTPGRAENVAISGDYAYVADLEQGLRIIDISDPQNPLEEGYFITSGSAHGVEISGQYAYVADGDSGLRIIDISNPSNPQEIGFCKTPGRAYDVDVSGEFAFVAAGYDYGLRIVDISNPQNPFEVGSYPIWHWSNHVTVSGIYAYVAAMNDGLRIIDVSDPAHPELAGVFDITNMTVDVEIAGSYAYVPHSSRFLVIDVSLSGGQPPPLVGYYCSPSGAIGVATDGYYAYVACHGAGLQIYEFLGTGVEEEPERETAVPSSMRVLQNPTKGDYIKLLLASPQHHRAEIALYNQIGQRLRTYQFNGLKTGENRLRLDAKGLPNGIYFLKLNGKPAGKVLKVG